jgi:hypothetical protein
MTSTFDWEGRLVAIAQQAALAWEAGKLFHVVKLELEGKGFFGGTQVEGDDVSAALQAVERVGWLLVDCGYVFVPVQERVLSEEDANILGVIEGIYTFRRPHNPSPAHE